MPRITTAMAIAALMGATPLLAPSVSNAGDYYRPGYTESSGPMTYPSGTTAPYGATTYPSGETEYPAGSTTEFQRGQPLWGAAPTAPTTNPAPGMQSLDVMQLREMDAQRVCAAFVNQPDRQLNCLQSERAESRRITPIPGGNG